MRVLLILTLLITACSTAPKAEAPPPLACPGQARKDGACVVTIPIAKPGMFQKKELKALADTKAFWEQNPRLVLQIQGSSSAISQQTLAHLTSIGVDGERATLVEVDSPTPQVVIAIWDPVKKE